MTPEHARNIQAAAAVLSAYCHDDAAALDLLLFDQLANDPPPEQVFELVDGMVGLCLAGCVRLVDELGVGFDTALAQLPYRDAGILPGVTPRRAELVEALKGLRRGHAFSLEAVGLEPLTVLTTAFNVALAIVEDLAWRPLGSAAEVAASLEETAARLAEDGRAGDLGC